MPRVKETLALDGTSSKAFRLKERKNAREIDATIRAIKFRFVFPQNLLNFRIRRDIRSTLKPQIVVITASRLEGIMHKVRNSASCSA